MRNNLQKLFSWLKEHSNILKLIFLASVLLFVVNQMTHILQGMTWAELQEVLAGQKKSTLLFMILTGMMAVLPMLTYDWVTVEILEENGKPYMSRQELFSSAWTTNTINNLAGFGGVIGATLRAKFYGTDVETKKVITTVSKVALFMLSGLSILCLFTFIDVFFLRADNPYRNYWVWLLGGSLFSPALFVFTRIKKQTLFSDFPVQRVLKLFVGSFGQWAGAMLTFLLIGKVLGVSTDPTQVYPLFVASTFIGMISMVPGGMGTFDVLMILGLSQVGVTREVAVAWLLYYRLFYYIFPFITGIASFLHQTGTKVNQFFDGLPKAFAEKFAHFILVCMVYFAGIMMVLLSTVPNLSNINHLFNKLLPFSFDFLDQTLNMLVGFLLLGLARGVANRVKKAYLPTLLVLTFCIINTISRTVSWKLILFYIFLIACIYLSRKEFYRKQLVFSWEQVIFDGLLYSVLFILYSIVGYYATDKISHGQVPSSFLLFPSEEVWLSGLVGLLISIVTILLLYQYLSISERPGIYFDKQRIEWMLEKYGENEYTHLLLLKDKRNYYYQEDGWDKCMFTFELQGNKLFVLGCPVGEKECIKEATVEFMHYADELGYSLVFYGISKDYVLLLHDVGYDFMKIGETGQLDLQADENYTDYSTQRIEVKRLAALGYTFRLIDVPFSSEIMTELERVSDEWVQGKGEKYFSVGRFKREYLNSSPVGIVYDSNRKIVAFASVKMLEEEKIVTYDLMRSGQEAPESVEVFLLSHIIESYRQAGYKVFDVGLAPLVNVGETTTAFFKERIVHVFYKYSYPIYSFQSVHEFKDSFVHTWESKYLSYGKQTNTIFLFIQLFLLIERGKGRRPRPVEGAMME